jgi:hypothetical protein
MAKKEKAAVSLPKQIAGVKIPKALREQLTALAKNPLVADLLAAGLVALAASLRDNPKVQKAAATAKGKAAGVASGVLKTATEVAEAATKFSAVVSAGSEPAAKAARNAKKPAAPKAKAPAAKKPGAPKPAAAKPAAAKPAAAKPTAKRPAAKRKVNPKTSA